MVQCIDTHKVSTQEKAKVKTLVSDLESIISIEAQKSSILTEMCYLADCMAIYFWVMKTFRGSHFVETQSADNSSFSPPFPQVIKKRLRFINVQIQLLKNKQLGILCAQKTPM